MSSYNAISEPSEYKAYNEGYQQGRADAIEEWREYLKSLYYLDIPRDMWDLGVDNTCNRMLKEKKND